MSQFIESISIEKDGSIPLLSYHQERVNRTLGIDHVINLSEIVTSIDLNHDTPHQYNQLKLRILYNSDGVQHVQVSPYRVRIIQTIQIIDIQFDYAQKSNNRDGINHAFALRGNCDDVLMIRDGLLTDTSYANVALYDGGQWYTPEVPLLTGCQRQSLLDQNQIIPKKIRIEALDSYPYLMLFNALIPYGRVIIPTSRIVR